MGGGDWSKEWNYSDVINAWRKNKNLYMKTQTLIGPGCMFEPLFGYITLILYYQLKKIIIFIIFGPKKSTNFLQFYIWLNMQKTHLKVGYILKSNHFHETKNFILDSNLTEIYKLSTKVGYK